MRISDRSSDVCSSDLDWLALRGRLEKDLALAGEPDKAQFARAAQAYREAYRRYGGSYSAINAASMLMLAGRKAQARQMAQAALQKLKAAANDAERFYALATESSAALLLDHPTPGRQTHVGHQPHLA